jgi:hypothetical protein
MKYGFVYQWENLLNEKKYIGSHYGNINDNYVGSGVYFKRAYEKNTNNFKRTILYIGKNYIEKEDELLKLYDVANNENYYNLKNDAIGGWKHIYSNPEEIKKRGLKISESKKGIFYKHLEYDKSGSNNPMYNKKHSEETKKKMSEYKIGKCNYSKKIIEKTENKIFESIKDCADYYKINPSTMSVLIRDKIITRGKCKNKIFIYA